MMKKNFKKSFKEFYPRELVLKLEDSAFHATFLDLNIPISNGKISNKLYDDKRDDLPFCIVRMPKFHSNIQSFVFYGTVMSEILRISRSSSSVIGFNEKTSALIKRMEKQGGNKRKLIKQITGQMKINSSFKNMIYQIEIS